MAGYKNHSELKRQRLIKLKEAKGRCEVCGKRANMVHHVDEARDNHAQENLAVLCWKCHRVIHQTGHKLRKSKYVRIYGKTATQLSRELSISSYKIEKFHEAKLLHHIIMLGFVPNQYLGYDSKYRRKYGLGIQEIAKLTGLNTSTLWRYEKEGELVSRLKKKNIKLKTFVFRPKIWVA